MSLVTEQEVARKLHLEKYGSFGINLTRKMMDILKIKDINILYDRHKHLEGIGFIDAVLNDLDIQVEISQPDLKRIPKSGPFILVSNHPLGGVDGLIMLKILLLSSPNAKIMANFLLAKIKPLASYICQVNPFEERKEIFGSFTGMRHAIQNLKDGAPVGIFPAGQVSVRKNGWYGMVDDKEWENSVLKLIKRDRVPVIPLYFHARNSEIFYILSGIHANFRTASLASEIVKSRHKKVTLRIGHPICQSMQNDCKDITGFGVLLRQKTYLLGLSFENKRMPDLIKFRYQPKALNILPALGENGIKKGVSEIQNSDGLLLESGNYQVLFTKLDKYPSLLTEIGRLREITFRTIGEGTNKALDLDKYDEYYHHLILWDKNAEKVAGAYRLGLGKEIYLHKGIKGFYMSALFRLSGDIHEVFKSSIEMGRAFITAQHQQKHLPLFLLWKGIFEVANRHPEYKYLIGAASISNHYSKFSQSLMVEYLKKYHFDDNKAKNITPNQTFRSVLKPKDLSLLHHLGSDHLRTLDKMIEEIEPQGLKIPVLIKKYLLQNAQILGFNIDTAFNDALDCLMYIEISNIEMTRDS